MTIFEKVEFWVENLKNDEFRESGISSRKFKNDKFRESGISSRKLKKMMIFEKVEFPVENEKSFFYLIKRINFWNW